MTTKETFLNILTEYVISKEAGSPDAAYFNGMINGLLIGLGEHENVVALCALYNGLKGGNENAQI